jgi:hypothetical protein
MSFFLYDIAKKGVEYYDSLSTGAKLGIAAVNTAISPIFWLIVVILSLVVAIIISRVHGISFWYALLIAALIVIPITYVILFIILFFLQYSFGKIFVGVAPKSI